MQNEGVIAEHANSFPIHFIVFDVLIYQGESLTNRYLKTRKQQLINLFFDFKASLNDKL